MQFYSRYPKLATVRWHYKFKAEYRTLAQALAAKREREEHGRILWPQHFGHQKASKVAKPRAHLQVRITGLQEETRPPM